MSQKWQRGFWSLIVTQFQGAFSDNALKYFILFLVIGAGISTQQQENINAEVGLLFSLPFILFSMVGGYLADRFSKRSVTISTKWMEICVIAIATAGLALHSLPLQLVAIFLISTQAALFGPSKYGLLPELLPEARLSWGNGVLELGTFLAIIFGTVAGTLLAANFRPNPLIAAGILAAVSFAGLATSYTISKVPASAPHRSFQWFFPAEVWNRMAEVRRTDRTLHLAIIGNTYFWFIAALLQLNIPVFGKSVLGADEPHIGLLMAGTALGIGVGSLAAGYLSGNKIEYGLIPLGSMGMTVLGVLLNFFGNTYGRAFVLLALLGFFAGFFVVPLNAMIQHRPQADRKGAIIAVSNLLSFIGVFLATGIYYAFTHFLHLSPHKIFFYSGFFALLATIYIVALLPQALLRLLLLFATHTLYRIRIEGRENIPAKGGALFVSNHLSFVDALLLAASTERNVRFIMFQDIYDYPLIKPFAKLMKAIPISSNLRPRDMIRSLRIASDSIREGRVVCIFAEGQITRIGRLLPFRRGMERIMKGVDAPIIPVHLDGVWGSMFSFERGRFFWKAPRRIPFPVTVSFGKPLPPTATAVEVRQAVQQLETEAFRHQKKRMETLHRSFVRTARSRPLRFAMADGKVPELRYGAALIKTIFLARRLKTLWEGQKMVGLLLPPSVGGALVNYAAMLTGKVPVNFNYTASNEITASCAQQCDVKTTVTSKAFLERLPNLAVPGKTILIEDLVASPTLAEKVTAFFAAWLLPFEVLEKFLGCEKLTQLDDLATVIFSSGSTGDPKGVMLSHYNIASNIDQIGRTFALTGKDRIVGILPFFHSFGFTATLWMPPALGIGVVFHPNPLDSATIGALVRSYKVTLLVATPTFLQAYIRRVPAEDFGSLQFVIVGAEKLPDRVAQAFEDTFGLRPLEGYGCTECSPVVAVNSRDFRAAGFRQVGAKRGKIGHPLPGVSVRIAHAETGEPLPIDQAGLMFVRGPNVMMGYLGRPEKTAEVLQDGWYNTGDIAMMDEDGFITITDRLSRFSKIAGEMVPHIKVEEKLHDCIDGSEQIVAVTGIPDGKKGERLIVLHVLAEEKLSAVLECFSATDLPPLWKPRGNQFFKIDAIPYLGTGKLDLRRIKELALQLAGEVQEV
ncbi:MAG: AMP-dependent synthetase and ligase [Acidobacteriaceae bacterium]|nr:AMP-dependent synthetase and ligase [Acidobacteriaceae bacterium]